MPLRTKVRGIIPSTLASAISAKLAADAARAMESDWKVPPVTFCQELGNEVVPDVAMFTLAVGKATIYDCLLSAVWEGSSMPLP